MTRRRRHLIIRPNEEPEAVAPCGYRSFAWANVTFNPHFATCPACLHYHFRNPSR